MSDWGRYARARLDHYKNKMSVESIMRKYGWTKEETLKILSEEIY